MPETRETLIRLVLEKSEKAILAAKNCFHSKDWEDAQNRAYYAVFYASTALGYLYGFESSKHNRLLGWFNTKLVRELGLFSPQMFAIYKRSYNHRIQSDYDITWNVEPEELRKDIDEAVQFLETVKKHIDENPV